MGRTRNIVRVREGRVERRLHHGDASGFERSA